MIGIKSWRYLETPFHGSSTFSSSNSDFDRNVKLRTQSRALRLAFLSGAIKYTILGYTVWRYWNRKKKERQCRGCRLKADQQKWTLESHSKMTIDQHERNAIWIRETDNKQW